MDQPIVKKTGVIPPGFDRAAPHFLKTPIGLQRIPIFVKAGGNGCIVPQFKPCDDNGRGCIKPCDSSGNGC